MNNLYAEVTDKIIALMEQGQIPWHKPWAGTSAGAISHSTGKPYSLINQILLMEPGEYITFNQCQKEGGRVKKGAKAKKVYFWKLYQKDLLDEAGQPVLKPDGTPKKETIPVLKAFQVFHLLNDCEGISPRWADKLPEAPAQPIEAAEATLREYVSREGIRLDAEKISGKAYYSPFHDLINLPCLSQYQNAAEYYSTAFHEATHSTGHPSRLHRFEIFDKNAAFGSEEYSKEELTAEIGAACILHQMGIETPDSLRNSAAYLQSWLKALKDDKQMIIGAASRAEKAVRLILNQTETTAEAEA